MALFSPPMTPHASPNHRHGPTFDTLAVTIQKPNLTELEIVATDNQSPKLLSASPLNLQSPTPPEDLPMMPSSIPSIQSTLDAEYTTSLVKLYEMINTKSGEFDRAELKLTDIHEETFNRLLEASVEGHLGQEALRLRKV